MENSAPRESDTPGVDAPPAETSFRTTQLVTAGLRRGQPTAPRVVGRVHYWSPVVRQVDVVDLPSRACAGTTPAPNVGYAAVQVMCALESLPTRSRLVAALLRMRFDDPGVTAVDVRVLTAWGGAPTTAASEAPLTSVSLLPGGGFTFSSGDPAGAVAIPPVCGGLALIAIPSGVTALTGTVRLDATTVTAPHWLRGFPRMRREHARTDVAHEFVVRLPEARHDTGGPGVAVPPAELFHPAVRLCVAADIQRFSRFRVPEATRAQQRFASVLARARRHAGIGDSEVELQQTGDGQFAILPPGLDETVVIPKLVEGLRTALTHINSDLSEHARLRLRVALHRGHMAPAPNGWVGGATIHVHRLLDSDVLRNALTDVPAASFAMLVPDVLYHEIITQRYDQLNPDDFSEVHVEMPAKGFAERAWLYVATS